MGGEVPSDGVRPGVGGSSGVLEADVEEAAARRFEQRASTSRTEAAGRRSGCFEAAR